MATKATTPEASDKPDPLDHVNMILAAEGPAPHQAQTIPFVTEQSQKLSEMMDNLGSLEDFGDLKRAAEAQLAAQDVNIEAPKAPSRPQEPVKLPPMRTVPSPRQATPKAPKDANVADYEPRSPSRRRRSGGSAEPVSLPTATPSTTTALNGDHVAALLTMVHTVGSTVLGPSFSIPPESAKAIGDAALPVLEDFGVAVASRAVHLLMLVATITMVEGPIVLTVVNDMKMRAEMQRSGLSTMTMSGAPFGTQRQEPTQDDIASAISMATGVMVGNAPE